MEEIEIAVLNWEKYNPPSDRAKHPYWFRFHRDSAISAGLDGMSAEHCWVWVQILSECSRKNSGTIRLRTKRLAELSQVSEETALATINILNKNNTIEVPPQSGELTPPIRGVGLPHIQTDIHTNRHTNISASGDARATLNFEDAYKAYPKKIGKKKGLQRLKKSVTTPEALEKFRQAVAAYSRYVAAQKTEARYVKHFDTFVGCWEDWINPDLATQTTNKENLDV